MTGSPQLTERQETLLRQAGKCRELASRLRAWKGHYNQNCSLSCTIGHIYKVVCSINELGLDRKYDLIGFSQGYEPGKTLSRCAHDGTPIGAAEWLEQHALKLEAQV